jgi:hypothetical protein
MPSLRSVLPASTLVDFFKRLIVFLAILLSSFSMGPSGALPSYVQLARQLPLSLCRSLNPLKSADGFESGFLIARAGARDS